MAEPDAGLGCVMGSYITGRRLDHDFSTTAAQYRREHNIPATVELNAKAASRSLQDFPIEHARLRSVWWHTAMFCASTAGYGFSLSTHLVVPLLLQFLSEHQFEPYHSVSSLLTANMTANHDLFVTVAYTATSIFSSNSTLLVDLYPDRSASATAVNNLARCSVGAAGVAVVDVLLVKFGIRWTFAALAGVTAVMVPLIGLEWVWGRRWRNARELRVRYVVENRDAGKDKKGVEQSSKDERMAGRDREGQKWAA